MDATTTSGVSVEELAGLLGGEILNCQEKVKETVDHLMVGTMCFDPSPLYFQVRTNKAVITRGDRADIQLGALETSTRCLILTGGSRPIANVMQRAEEKGVPVILVSEDTVSVLRKLETGLSQVITMDPEAIETGSAGEETADE